MMDHQELTERLDVLRGSKTVILGVGHGALRPENEQGESTLALWGSASSDSVGVRELAEQGLAGHAYEMPRQNHYLGRIVRGGLFWPDRKIRLFDRRHAHWGGTNPHDRVIVDEGSAVTRLEDPIEHLSYRNFRHHLRTIDSFTRIAARAMRAKGRRGNPLDLLVRPPAVFVKSLLLKRGFVDGWRGLVIAAMAAYTDWLKYWRLIWLPREEAS